MKRFFAGLLCLWYLVSIMGLDVHNDIEHGKTFVVPALLAQSCEMIHPHEHCHDTACAHDGGTCATEHCEEDEDCCTDDFESVSITGTDSGQSDLQTIPAAAYIAVSTELIQKLVLPENFGRTVIKGPPPVHRDISVLDCVFRA